MPPGNLNYLKGHFLIAMSDMMDPNFSKSVTCICEHSISGTLGVIINRIYDHITAKNIFDELSIDCTESIHASPVHFGGPVHAGEIFILHGPPFNWQGCFQITQTLALSNTQDIINAIANGTGPRLFLICIGCAGWGQGQLESEIKQNAWLTSPISEEIIFNTPVDRRWKTAMHSMGINPHLLSNTPGHA